jgi:5-methylcytosine-specific restriction endonuclease McrA
MAKIPDKVRKLIFERDGGKCPHCGETEAIGLQHRINRGAGGSKLLDIPANLLTFCNSANAAMESNADFAKTARYNGWKLSRWDDPTGTAFYDATDGMWHLIDNTYGRRRAI